jgi:hypothetical protein
LLLLGGMTAAARGQTQPDPETLGASLTEMLSLLTFGTVSVPVRAVQVTRTGADFHVRLPLNGFVAPAGASAEAVARPDGNGAWDVASMTFPSAGALGRSIDDVVSYTIGRQAIQGRLDPKLTAPSTMAADLRTITLQSAADGQTTAQSIERVTINGVLSGRSDGRMDLRGQDAATNWHILARDPGRPESDSLVRQINGHFALTGLDHGQAGRLVTAVRTLMQTAKTERPAAMRGVLDATVGLLTRIDANETFDGMRFNLGNGNAGTVGRSQLRLEAAAEEQRLNAAVDLAIDGFSLTSLSADPASFVPHHLAVRSVLTGVPLGPLMALLQAAIAPNPDQAALQRQAAAVLSAPGSKAAIESVAFDAGPVRVKGSARFQPRADGNIGVDLHLSASGIDAALAQMQGRPNLQGVVPFILMAKGIGRAQGDTVVWDISFGGGPLTINGMPFGQPSARTR